MGTFTGKIISLQRNSKSLRIYEDYSYHKGNKSQG